MTPKERALDITEKLQAAEAAGATPELAALHATLKEGLEEHADLLGFDQNDLDDIEAAGTAARGGTGKE